MDESVIVTNAVNEVKLKTHYVGKVVKTSLAGALVDIGAGTPAYLHVSQIVSPDPTQPIKRVEDFLQIGQDVEVWVKRIREGRVELTMVKPLDLDWKDIKVEMVVKGKVVKLEKFGAFVEIGAERPGLIHISELAHGYVRTPADIVKEGDEVEAQVLDVNRKKKQIKLSLKALQEAPVKDEAPVQLPDRTESKNADTRRRKPGKNTRRRGEDRFEGSYSDYTESPSEPEPTTMEILLREAMEKANVKKQAASDKPKSKKKISQEHEEIFNRTLESKPKN
jgi:predicted RNA-binding protein with RPS1 domain